MYLCVCVCYKVWAAIGTGQCDLYFGIQWLWQRINQYLRLHLFLACYHSDAVILSMVEECCCYGNSYEWEQSGYHRNGVNEELPITIKMWLTVLRHLTPNYSHDVIPTRSFIYIFIFIIHDNHTRWIWIFCILHLSPLLGLSHVTQQGDWNFSNVWVHHKGIYIYIFYIFMNFWINIFGLFGPLVCDNQSEQMIVSLFKQ